MEEKDRWQSHVKYTLIMPYLQKDYGTSSQDPSTPSSYDLLLVVESGRLEPGDHLIQFGRHNIMPFVWVVLNGNTMIHERRIGAKVDPDSQLGHDLEGAIGDSM
jgi:hypothetical protein